MKTFITTLLAATALTAISSGAMAADLAAPPAAAPAMAAPAPTNWDGPYIGASVGYGWGTASDSYTGPSTGSGTANLTGWLLGVQAGYNFHLSDNIVAGVEGNIDWLNETGTFDTFGEDQTINWEGSIRGRLGFEVDSLLPYVEAGVAFANSTFNGSGANNTQTGWTVGAGVEFMLADNLSANVEYRYSDYGTATYQNGSYNDNVHLSDSTLRLGLNYHF